MDLRSAVSSSKSGSGLSQNTAILILCMGIASFLWLIVQLNQSYTGAIPVNIFYTNIPEELVPTYPLESQGSCTVNATGFQILLARLKAGRISVYIDQEQYNNQKNLTGRDLLKDISEDLPAGIQLIGFSPDTIHLQFEQKASKVVPVKLLDSIGMAKQFDLMRDIELTPESVTVYGPSSRVDTITFWPTDSLLLSDLKESITDTLSLYTNSQSPLSTDPDFVVYDIAVESYTESNIKVPIRLVNAPKDQEATTYPKEVSVKFLVGLSNHEKVDAAYFDVIADLADVNLEQDAVIELSLKQYPDFIKNPVLEPNEVEYIIYR